MNAIALREKLKSNGIDIVLDGEDLKVIGPNSKLTPDIISDIRIYKLQLIQLLNPQKKSLKKRSFKTYEYPDGSKIEFSKDEFDEIVSFFSEFLD